MAEREMVQASDATTTIETEAPVNIEGSAPAAGPEDGDDADDLDDDSEDGDDFEADEDEGDDD